MHRCLAIPVPTFRLRDSLSECYITGRCLPAMTSRVLVMGDEVRTEENFFRRTITINSFTGRRWSIRSDGGQHLQSPRHFSSAEAEANGLLEELYPRTLGRFGGNGLFHDGSPNAQRVDDLLCAVLHPLGGSPSETGRIHAVPGSGVDGAAGAKHDYGGVGKPEGLPLSAARPRCEVLPILSRTDQDGKCESTSIASKKPESELVRGTLGEVGQRRVSVEADPVWRIAAAASVAAIYGTLPRGAQPSRQRQSDFVSFAP